MTRPVSPALNDSTATPRNTMPAHTCSSVFAALRTLEKNHRMPSDLGSQKRLNECILQFVRDLVSESILSKNEAESFQIRLIEKVSKFAGFLDRGVLHHSEEKEEAQNENIALSLNQGFVIIFTAMQDKSGKYWTSDYKDRLKKFYGINQELIEHPVCHSGFRNEWVIRMLYQDYLNLDLEPSVYEEELEKRVAIFKNAHRYFDLICNSFAMLNTILYTPDREAFSKQISQTLKENHLIISDESLTGDWYHSCIQEKEGQSIFTLQQYDLNRLCWQALSTSPCTWSDAFQNILEKIISLLEKPAENNPLHENLVRSSYPEEFIAQLKWLLSLSKMPLRFHHTPIFIPCCLEGIEVLESNDAFLDSLRKPGRDKWTLIRTLVFSKNFAPDANVISKTLSEFPKKEWPEVLNCILRSGDTLVRVAQVKTILNLLPQNERWPFLSNLPSWHFDHTASFCLMFKELASLLLPSHRMYFLEKAHARKKGHNDLQPGVSLILRDLHYILLQLPESDWEKAFFSQALGFSLYCLRPEEEDLGKFFNFLPKKRWPQFLAWLGETRRVLFKAGLFPCLHSLCQGKRLPFLRALSPYLREIFPYSPTGNPEFHSFFSETLPILEGDERAEFLNLASQVLQAPSFLPNDLISYLKLLEEHERWPFLHALRKKPWDISDLVFFEHLPKANWADLAEFSTIPQSFIRGELDCFWRTISPSQWQPLAHFFKTSVKEILAQPKRCFEAFSCTPAALWPEIIKASGENATWASLIPSCDKLCAILSSTPSNSAFKIKFLETMGLDLNRLIQNQTDFLNLLKAMDEPFLSQMKLYYLRDFAQNFDLALFEQIPSQHRSDVLCHVSEHLQERAQRIAQPLYCASDSHRASSVSSRHFPLFLQTSPSHASEESNSENPSSSRGPNSNH